MSWVLFWQIIVLMVLAMILVVIAHGAITEKREKSKHGN